MKSWQGQEIYLIPKTERLVLQVHPSSSQCVLRAPSKEKKHLRHEADHLTLSTTKIKNEWSYTSTPPYTFMVYTGTTLSLRYLSSLQVFSCTIFPTKYMPQTNALPCVRCLLENLRCGSCVAEWEWTLIFFTVVNPRFL